MKKQEDEFIRKRKARQKLARKRRRIRIGILLAVLLLALMAVLSVTVLFPIKSIAVTGNERYDAETVAAESGIKVGDNILAASQKRCRQQLREVLPYIKDVKFKQELTGKLTLRITEAKAYQVYVYQDKYYPVSNENHILEKCDKAPGGLLTIAAKIKKPRPGQDIVFEKEKAKKTLSTILEAAKNKNLKLTRIDLLNEVDITLEVKGKYTVRLGTANYLTQKINHFATIVSGKKAPKGGTIDLSIWTPDNAQAILRN